MSEKADLIGRVRGAYKDLQLVVRDLPDEKMNEVCLGEWSSKDLLAHLASWDEFAAEDLRRVGRGHVPCLAAFKPAEIDQWNEFFMKMRRFWPLVQVRFESQHSHDDLVKVLNFLPETMFAAGHMVSSYCTIASQHYGEHAGHIREGSHRSQLGKEPEPWAGTSSSPN